MYRLPWWKERLLRGQDPFGKLVVKAKGDVTIHKMTIFDAAERGRTVSTAEATELANILKRVTTWPTTLRITLARKILECVDKAAVQTELSPKTRGSSAHDDERPPRGTRGFSADQVIQLLHSDQPAPTDEECDRILEEELTKKYSP
jgi:hypothetical protein